MEYLIEFLFELVIEGSIEASKSPKLPKWVRYPLIVIIAFFFLAVIGLVFLAGFLSLKENIFMGIFFLLLGLFLLIASIIKFRKLYLIKVNKEEK